MISKTSKIFVAGHKGLAGSAIYRNLILKGYSNVVTRTHLDLDLESSIAVDEFFQSECPEIIFLAAAKVGGIKANNEFRADFISKNLSIQCNVINSSIKYETKKLIFLGSNCIYPKNSIQPITEDSLLTGPLETTNEPYAIAKIAGIKMIEAVNYQFGKEYFSVMPASMYGMHDNYDLDNGHVLASLLLRFHHAKSSNENTIKLWGSGSPKREFLFSDDMAEACIFLVENNFSDSYINIGTGKDISIMDLADLIAKVVGYNGKILFDKSKPDGAPRKLLDSTRINNLGWKPKVNLLDGIELSYAWMLEGIN